MQGRDIDQHIVAGALPYGGNPHGNQSHFLIAQPADLPRFRYRKSGNKRAVYASIDKYPDKADDDKAHQVWQKEYGPKKLFERTPAIEEQSEKKSADIGKNSDESGILHRYPYGIQEPFVRQGFPIVCQADKMYFRVEAVCVR